MDYKLFIPSVFIGFFVLMNFGFMGFLVLVVSFLTIATILTPLYSEPTKYNHKKSKTVPKKNVSSNTKSDSNLVRKENKNKPATIKQKKFIKDLITQNDYELFKVILVSNKLIEKLTMDLASNLISHLLYVENSMSNKLNSEYEFFNKFPSLLEKYFQLKCLGITNNRTRCTRLINYPRYFCKIHSTDYKIYEFEDLLSREYFYRSNCQKFIKNLFEFLTLESKENNFKLEHLIKKIIKEYVGDKEYYKLNKSFKEKSFKELFFSYDFFNLFSNALFDSNLDSYFEIKLECIDCSLNSFKKNNLCDVHRIYSDFHLLYEYDLFPKEDLGLTTEFYLKTNLMKSEPENYLIEVYYMAVKNFNSFEPTYEELEGIDEF